MLGGHLCILGAHSVQSCYTISISASLPCICVWQISQIQTCWSMIVGPGFVWTSPAFTRSSASHPVVPNDRFAKITVNRTTIAGGGCFDTIFTAVYWNRCDSSATCRRCRLEPGLFFLLGFPFIFSFHSTSAPIAAWSLSTTSFSFNI